ncbi:glycosyltransferase [Elizabethkingia anophelis]|nr:glycosyltransferase [Elizabethkingia anophelis]
MKEWTFRKWNTFLGWGIFVVAAITYLSTIEPNLSFWDCGEYISSAVKLQVTHAPGAALFQLIGAVVAMFAFGEGHHYGTVINAMSALCSAFTILFLFWTITHLVRRILNKEMDELTGNQIVGVLFSGVIGALAFTFSDTFWFSAVEGEVYAMSSMFIALLLWLICKWENEFNESDNERWIILIFFITGLSVGVHMMCMLTVPAICLIYYSRKYTFTWKSFIIANLVTLVILGLVFKGVFPFIMTMFAKSEITFVNGFGLPFNSGTIFAFLVLAGLSYLAINYARKKKNSIFQTIALSLVYMIIGFSCWMVIPIRAMANPAINLNDPDNAIGMLDYYNRVQYGDWPTSYGENYTAYLDYNGMEKNEDGSYKTKKTGDIYEKDDKTGRYVLVGQRDNIVFNKNHVGFFPRMFNSDKDVMSNYISMYGAPDFTFNYSNPDVSDDPQAHKIFDELKKKYNDGSIKVDDYMQVKNYNLINIKKPSFSQNFDYFVSFQNGYYFVRYLLWNFVGRQNDLQGQMENTNGNWISGISFIDNAMHGDQSKMPAYYKNESTVAFFFLPLLLGLVGFFFQLNKDFGRFYAILSLFIITSIGIVYYTGVKPFEPRERDYAMVGSFYAFAIWIGLGAAAVFYFLDQKVKNSKANWVAGVILLGIPFMMGFQNYRVHDRSHKYAAYDYAYSFLNSLPKETIMISYGDNDTYPVWGIQQTEGFRNDVRVAHQALLTTPWFIDQMMRKVDNSNPIPLSMSHENYKEGVNDQVYVMSKEDWNAIYKNLESQGAPGTVLSSFRKYLVQDSMTMKDAVNFLKMKSEDKDTVLKFIFGDDKYEKLNFLPVSKFVLPVNVNNAVKAGIIKPQEAGLAVDHITIDYAKSSIMKNNVFLLDLLATFDWKRPISFSAGGVYDAANIFFLGDYLQFDGFSYRLVPIKTETNNRGDMGRVDADELYNVVKNYKWGNFKDLYNHYDETATQNIISYRMSASRAAQALVAKGDKKRALELLDLASTEIPVAKYNDSRSLAEIVYGYIVAGQEQKGLKLAEELKKNIFNEYDYFSNLDPSQQKFVRKQLSLQPYLYSVVVSTVSDAYEEMGEKDKAYQYIVNSITPVDKRFSDFVKGLQAMGKEKAYKESENVQKITPFYEYLFNVMKPYDSTYSKEKMDQITSQVIKATQ